MSRRAPSRKSSRGFRRPSRRTNRGGLQKLAWIGLLALAVPLVAAPIVYSLTRPGASAVALDAATGCAEAAPAGYRLVIVDATDPITPGQRARLRSEIDTYARKALEGDMVVLGEITGSEPRILFSKCQPRSGAVASQISENPRLIQARYDAEFAEPYAEALDTLMAAFPGAGLADDAASNTRAVVRETGGETVLTLGESIIFATGRSDLAPEGQESLRALGLQLARQEASARIEGHADATGDAHANQLLSEARARAVADALASGGLTPSRIKAIGMGADHPVATNETEAGRAANRRVEIILARQSPLLESIQTLISKTPMLAGRDPIARVDLLLASDLLQNSDAANFYRGDTWTSFSQSPAFDRLSRNMTGFDVHVLRFPRPDARIQDPRTVEDFWARYFDHQDTRAVVSSRVLGDL